MSDFVRALDHLGSAWSREEDLWNRFWSKVDIRGEDDCWIWRGARKGTKGHHSGNFMLFKGRTAASHRVAYMFAENLDDMPPAYLDVHHECDNGLCCNPRHLRLGTAGQRMLLCKTRGRLNPGRLVGERNGAAVLDDVSVRNIRRKHRDGASVRALSREYKVDRTVISAVVHRISWKHVPEEASVPCADSVPGTAITTGSADTVSSSGDGKNS